MVALDKQFVHHRGTKPRSCGRWRNESWQTGKSAGHGTADILSAGRPRDTSNSSNNSCENLNHRKASFTGVVPSCSRGENRFCTPGSRLPTPELPAYYLQDANWDTTAVVGFNATAGTWDVVQRYVYSPYGSITVLTADRKTPPAGTQPVVSNLYQGMTLDAVTGLYDERFRNYSPSLGTWISQDPLQYVNGANTYQFVGSGPAGRFDGWGLDTGSGKGGVSGLQFINDLNLLTATYFRWSAGGRIFAGMLLKEFIDNGFPKGHAGEFLEFAANEIKSDPLYRRAAKAFFQLYAEIVGPGTHKLQRHWPPATEAFSAEFYYEWGSDLMDALGGAHFGFAGGSISVKQICIPLGPAYRWKTSGLEMVQRDYYSFAPFGLGRQIWAQYIAAHQLQVAGWASPFWHHETWRDGFSGLVYLNYPLHVS